MRNERLEKYEQGPQAESTGKAPKTLQAVLLLGTLLVGLLVGKNMDNNLLDFKAAGGDEQNPHKLVSIIDFIEENYVDSIQKRELIDDAIASILSNLDPHSYYITPEELAAMSEPLEGEFDGIGVEFMIQRDSLMVVKTVNGGPSEEAGLLAGDRIVKVDGQLISGSDLDSEKAMKLLKGKKGTEVRVTVKRRGADKLIDYTIQRGAIPIESVSAAFIVAPEVGYLKLERFAKTSYDEFMKAMSGLEAEGAKKLILDLRGNGGGLLNAATDIIEEFLPEDRLIVYVEGVHQGRQSTISRRKGKFRDMELVVLIDQGSASASEIVAGALQDWDRSLTVGRRSFGKGLVQHEIELSDHSALRLTVARYYTPLGRCIQKPYGDSIDYEGDFFKRLSHGEYTYADSTQFPDSLKFTTRGGRTVYGGGGIMPDVFVPIDSMLFNGDLSHLVFGGLMREFAFNYVDANRNSLASENGDENEFEISYEVSEQVLQDFLAYARRDSVKVTESAIAPIRAELKNRLKAQIGKNLFDDQVLYKVMLKKDTDLARALEVLQNYDRYAIVKK